MTSRQSLIAVVFGIVALLSSAAANAGGSNFAPGQVVVALRPGFTVEEFNTRYTTATLDDLASRRVYLVTVPAGQGEQSFVDIVRADPDVTAADVNFFAEDVNPEGSTQSIFLSVEPADYANDPSFDTIFAPQAHTLSTGVGVLVGIVDSGVDAAHPLLAGRIAPGGFDFFDNDPIPNDAPDNIDNNQNGAFDEFVGHGTLVAGLIARIAPSALIMPIRVLGTDGECTTFTLTKGVFHALDSGCDIINVSLGVDADPFLLRAAAAEAASVGVMIVAAAGNDNRMEPARSPAALANLGVVGVGAVGPTAERAEFSNYGSSVAYVAPGVGVVSLTPAGGYGSASGTSFSAPMVTGVAALVRALCPSTSLTQWRAALSMTATNIDAQNPGYIGLLGSGLVNAASASLLASSNCLPACPGDYDRNATRSLADINTALAFWGFIYPPGTLGPGDGDGDLSVGFSDIAVVLTNFAQPCP